MSKITFESVMEEIRANLGEARLKQIAEEESSYMSRWGHSLFGIGDKPKAPSASAKEEDVPFLQRPYANMKRAATAVSGAVSDAVSGARRAVSGVISDTQKRVDMKNDPGPDTAPAPAAPATAVRPASSTATAPKPVAPSPGATPAAVPTNAARMAPGAMTGNSTFKPEAPKPATPAAVPTNAARMAPGAMTGNSTFKPEAPKPASSPNVNATTATGPTPRPNVRTPVPTAPAASTVKAPSSADEYSRSRNSGSDEVGGSAADLIRGDRAAAAERAASKPMQENFEQFVMNRAKGKSS